MKKILKKFLSIVLAFIMGFSVNYLLVNKSESVNETVNINLSDEELVRKRIVTFVEAYNSGDSEQVLKCISAKEHFFVKAVSKLIESKTFSGFNFENLFSIAIGLIGGSESIAIEIQSIKINNEKKATVNAVITFDMYASHQSEKAKITLVKEKGDWFLDEVFQR